VKRVLFVVSEDWYFVSHRLHLAVAAARAGFHVGVLTRVSRHRAQIEAAGMELIDWPLHRRSRNPVLEARAILAAIRALRRFRPDLIHAVALKPVLYASFASRLAGPALRVFALGGLGFTFGSARPLARRLRPVALRLLRLALRGAGTRLILQNPHDVQLLVSAGVVETARIALIRGAGVDTLEFSPQPEPASARPLVILPGRMLWDKGVADFVECARTLALEGVPGRFALVGEPDPHNPESVPEEALRRWVAEGAVEWWGRRDDMPAVYAQASLICLPSYHEGLPKSLLEAASSGRAIVAYDIPGCREIVEDGVSGCLVPLRDVQALSRAVQKLLADPALRSAMGERGRMRVMQGGLSQEAVAQTTLGLWQQLLGTRAG
jgi:glycosyltransferase involved in cell wall biosynthesis